MATGNFEKCAAFTFQYEGGYVDHPRDPGGATNHGITIAVLAAWRGRPVTKAEVRALTKSEAEQIYRKNYWLPIGGEGLPRGVDLAAYDLGVNSGVGRARKYLAATTGAAPITRAAKICDMRLSFVQGLRTWGVFGKGWGRRIAACKALAMRMAMESSGYTKQAQKKELEVEATNAAARSKKKEKQSATAGGGAVAAPTAPAAMDGGWGLWIFFGFVALVFCGIAFAMWKASQAEKEQIEAFKAEVANVEV